MATKTGVVSLFAALGSALASTAIGARLSVWRKADSAVGAAPATRASATWTGAGASAAARRSFFRRVRSRRDEVEGFHQRGRIPTASAAPRSTSSTRSRTRWKTSGRSRPGELHRAGERFGKRAVAVIAIDRDFARRRRIGDEGALGLGADLGEALGGRDRAEVAGQRVVAAGIQDHDVHAAVRIGHLLQHQVGRDAAISTSTSREMSASVGTR